LLLLLVLPFPEYLVVDDAHDIVISFGTVGNGACGAILDPIPHDGVAAALKQIERTPAEQAGPPVGELMAGKELTFVVHKLPILHLRYSSLGNSFV
jgi:hypothetical protein